MTTKLTLAAAVLGGLALSGAGPAQAVATIGGVISLIGGNGTCNVSGQVPGNTPQDTFHLQRATGCAGTSATGELRGDAATRSIGLYVDSAGNGIGSSLVAAQVQFTDQWKVAVPAGTPWGNISLPVSLHMDGSVSANALSGPGIGHFIDYAMNIGVPYSFNVLSANGNVSTTGAFSRTVNGIVTWSYTGQPLTVAIDLTMGVPGLFEGTVDFYNTASASMVLPAGYSATTSSGLPLVFPAVPEPAPGALFAAGLAGLALARRCARRPL